MIRVYYPDLFSPDDPQAAEVRALAARTWELTQFLVRKLGVRRVDAGFEGKVAYHDACHALRELRIHDEPRELIRSVRGCSLVELPERGACCGFGGAFSVKFAEISTAILHDKVQAIRNAGADVLVSTDSSCLMQMSGAIRTLHIAELLAGGGR
jgi:L-lactate dehydrogenase complex protein LldE